MPLLIQDLVTFKVCITCIILGVKYVGSNIHAFIILCSKCLCCRLAHSIPIPPFSRRYYSRSPSPYHRRGRYSRSPSPPYRGRGHSGSPGPYKKGRRRSVVWAFGECVTNSSRHGAGCVPFLNCNDSKYVYTCCGMWKYVM